ncbi:hypothetical protein E1091_19435, partial [Micromonospora fluostatini]
MDATTSTINMTVGSVGAGTVASRIVSTVGFFMTSPSLDTEQDLARIAVASLVIDRLIVRANPSGLRVTAYDRDDVQLDTVVRAWPTGADPRAGWVGVQVVLERPTLAPTVLIRIRTYPVGSTTITTSTSTGISTGSLGGMTQVTLLAAGVVG